MSAYATAAESGAFAEHNGVWGRMEGTHGRNRSRVSTSGADYESDIFKMQAGLDGLFYDGAGGTLSGGFTVHYSHGKTDIYSDHGDGDISTDGYGFGGTLTWYDDSGFYLDGQAQATWYKSDLHSDKAEKILAAGNDGFGYALSAEAGQRFAAGENWFITPQVQLIYSNVRFDDFITRWDVSESKISLQRGASLQGRLGVSFDYQQSWQNAQGQTNRSTVYAIANLYHEFLDGTRVDVSETELINKQDRLWAGLGIGGSYNWNDDKYSVYAEGAVNTSLSHFGDSYSYKGTAGLRVKW